MTTRNRRKKIKVLKNKISRFLELSKKVKVKFTKLDNKTRKGKYLYIKLPKEKGKYFRHNRNVDLNTYVEEYITNLEKDKKTIQKLTPKNYLQKIKSTPTLNSMISKGSNTLNNKIGILGIDRKSINNTYRDLLRPLVNDEKLIEILSENHNIEKFKYRIESTLEIHGDFNEVITIRTYNKTIDNLITDLKDLIDNKELWTKDLTKVINKGYEVIDIKNTDIKEDGYFEGANKKIIKRIKDINIKLKYTKGR